MSEPDSPTRGDLHHHHQRQQQPQQQLLNQSPSQHNADERDDANNSIIGKVKSRVSSIFPQKLTQWFSPSSTATSANSSNGGVGRRRRRNEECEDEDYERANNSDEESNNSAEEEGDATPVSTQPPTKRSRLNVEVTRTNFKDSQSFVSSTPTTGARRRTTHLNLYGKQKEPAYNFSQTKITTNISRSVATGNNLTVDSADIIEVVPERNVLNTSMSSSRRSLNIPSTSSTEGYRNLQDLKRRPVSSLRSPATGVSPSMASYTPQRTSTTILEVEDDYDDEEQQQQRASQTIVVEEVDDDEEVELEDDNEENEEIAKVTSKKQKFTNGNLAGRSSSVASESGESRSSSVAQAANKSGLFNPTNRGLRTLSGNGLNFYSHLEGRKSLFSEKNMPGMLNNSTLSLTSLNRRQFNSSIYGSTSALSDSRLLNTSSPFYKGQTTYGGAAAYNKFNRTMNQSVRIAPTLIRPTSSLSTLSSSTNSLAQANDAQSNSALSSTAKRILELINDFSTPLNDAKKMASNIKTPSMLNLNNRSSSGKRFSEADLAASRSVRLSSVRTPYTRPAVTLTPTSNDSKKLLPSLKELQVPSMSQLLQMRKMQNYTERSRHIANTSKSALNRECEYKLPCENEVACADKTSNKHTNKIKNKVTTSTRVSSKNVNANDEEAPVPANLPNIAFPFMDSVPKIDISVKPLQAPPTTASFTFGASPGAKPTNNFTFGTGSKPAEVQKSSPAPSKPAMNFSFGTSATPSTPVATSNEFKFSTPLSLNNAPAKGDLTPISNFKFSSPLAVGEKIGTKKIDMPVASLPQLKTGSVLDALKKQSESKTPVEPPPLKFSHTSFTGDNIKAVPFGSQFNKAADEWECSECMIRNKSTVDSCAACTTPRTKKAAAAPSYTNSLDKFPVKNTFGDALKPKAGSWECSACMVRNECDTVECVACNTKKPGAVTPAKIAPVPAKPLAADVGFKALAAKQTASKWECDGCMTRNDAERNKCVCCEQAKPGTQVVSESVPKFSFGTSSATKFTFGFGAAGAPKESELKADAASKTESKTGFTFGVPAAKTSVPASSTGFVFGAQPAAVTTSSAVSTGKDVPDVVSSNTSGFKFGIQPAESSKTDATPTGFSFGVKTEAKPSSVKFNLPSTTADSKSSSSTSTPTITSTSSSSSAAPSSLFSPIASSAFGAAQTQKSEEPKPAAAITGFGFGAAAPRKSSEEPKPAPAVSGFSFGTPAPVPAPTATASNSQTPTVKPIAFGSSPAQSQVIKAPSNAGTFGSPIVTPATAAETPSSHTSGFIFGKQASTTAAFTTNSPSSGFVFGNEAASKTSTQVGSSASAATQPSFGTPAAGSNAATTVSSSTAGFFFGKHSTTPLFGSSTPPTSTTASTSDFRAKPASLFGAAAAPLSSAATSSTSSTLATSIGAGTSTPFVFGSGAASNTSQPSKPAFGANPFESASTAASTTTVAAASSWPTNTFTFGSSKPPEEVKSNAAPVPAFGSPASIFGQTTSVFGEVKATPAAPSSAPTFGAPSSGTSLFGSSVASPSAGAVQQPPGNVFGAQSSSLVFGSMNFGAAPTAAVPQAASVNTSNQAQTAVPTFGSLGSSSFSSGGFGSLAAASSGSTDGASAPKKADIAFNFGSAQNSGNSGFSFGSNNNNNKPAADSVFKFSTSSTPSFNFTGTSESSNATIPFPFAAPTSTPAVFNFGGVEGSNSGGPFQFNAAAPAAATNNIFAPTPGSQAVGQQARRKMRTSIRRITPR